MSGLANIVSDLPKVQISDNSVCYEIAHFREITPTDQCELAFGLNIRLPNFGTVDEEIRAVRQRTDNVASLLKHIKNKLLKILQDKINNDKSLVENFDIPVALKEDAKLVEDGMVLRNFPLRFTKREGITFEIFDKKYVVLLNAPLIKCIKLPSVLYANFSVQPIKFNAIFMKHSSSIFSWYKSKDKKDWTKVGDNFNYVVTQDDIGCFLKFVCAPVNDLNVYGDAAECISEVKVEEIGELPKCPFEKRHEFTKTKLSGEEFRVVTYNILAERYTNIDENYNYCDPKYLCMNYRKQLIFKELHGYNADIICLQEVDNRHYINYFKDYLKAQDYYSFYNKKGNKISEGLAIFFNKSRFKKVESRHIVFSDEIRKRSYKQIWELVKRNNDLRTDFLKQPTSFQVTVLKIKDDVKNRHIMVGNTHLYYHPDANHIRLIQVTMATSFLTYLKKKYERSGINISVIFCGDFNSSTNKSLYPFMLEGTISPSHEDCLKISDNGRAILHHEFIFESACGTPKYTNYTPDFKGCLDYIFIESNKMAVTQVIPLTDEQELLHHDGLPNKYFPSDHLALVVDLKMKY